MRTFIVKISVLLVPVSMLVSCKELPKEMEVVERRELCQYDNPAVYRSSYSSWLGTQPLDWRQVSPTEFRLLNYVAGEATQIALGQVNGGGIEANLNRWIREFDQEVIENLDGLETIEMLDGKKAYVLQLTGTFKTKMGGMPVKKEGWAVTGIICDVQGGSLVTIKMMGPVEEVKAQQENLMNFAKSLRMNELQTPSERSKKEKTTDNAEGGGY